MSYHRKQYEKKQKYRNRGLRVPRNVYDLCPHPLEEMPGSVAKAIVQRTERMNKQARNAA